MPERTVWDEGDHDGHTVDVGPVTVGEPLPRRTDPAAGPVETAGPERDVLRKLAEAATPGVSECEFPCARPSDDDGYTYVLPDYACEDCRATERTRRFIAAVSPDVVLALLDEIDRLNALVPACPGDPDPEPGGAS